MMEDNAKDQAPSLPPESEPFDFEYAAILLELTEKQKAFCSAILKGCTQVQAARLAGYSGNDAALRSQGSKIIRSPAVTSFLAWARNGRAGVPDDPASVGEIERTLSKHLRGSDKQASLRASELLTRLHIAREESRQVPAPEETLNKLAETGELGLCIAVLFSRKLGLRWDPKVPVAQPDEARQSSLVRAALTDAERSRVDNALALQNRLAEAPVGSPRSPPASAKAAAPTSHTGPAPGDEDDGAAAVGNADPVAAMAFNRNPRSRLF